MTPPPPPSPSNEAPNLSLFRKELNLRDLGGYPSRDGRHVKRGLIYRSGALGEARPNELQMIHQLNLRYILDLRSEEEALELPDPSIPGAFQERISGAYDASDNEINMSPQRIYRLLVNPRRKDPDPEDSIISAVAEIYTSLAFDSFAYRKLMEKMETGCAPLLFHCSAGKDRTGIGAIIILLALGVDEETIVNDFTLTNEYRKSIIDAQLARHPLLSKLKPFHYAISAVEGVQESFGARVIDEIHQEYGATEVYLEKEFGLGKKRLEGLRKLYLE